MDAEMLAERLLGWAVSIVRLVSVLPNSAASHHIGNQLLRSATSAGANYEEARAAESRADFVHKLQIVLKELRESRYWLRLICQADMLSHTDHSVVMREVDDLCNIIASSIATIKGTRKSPAVRS